MVGFPFTQNMFTPDNQPFWYRVLRIIYIALYAMIPIALFWLGFVLPVLIDGRRFANVLTSHRWEPLFWWNILVVVVVYIATLEIVHLAVVAIARRWTPTYKKGALVFFVALTLFFLFNVFGGAQQAYCRLHYDRYLNIQAEEKKSFWLMAHPYPARYAEFCQGITTPIGIEL